MTSNSSQRSWRPEGESAQPLRARWIAPRGEKKPNYTFLARKKFALERIPAEALLRACADSRYTLYLNGQLVGVGPVKHSHKRYFYDCIDVAKLLRAGSNVLAAEVHCSVIATYLAAPVTPALWVQLDGIAQTDASWQVRPDPSRRSDSPLYTEQTGFSELRDMRKEIVGWQLFTDSGEGWAEAEELGGANDLGGRALVPRDIPALTSGEHSFQRMIAAGGVPWAEGDVEKDTNFADLMQSELHFKAGLPSFQSKEGSLKVIPSRTGRGGYCIVDFERELIGSVLIDLEAPAGTILDIGYSESLQDGRVNTRRYSYRFADRYILRAGRQRIEHRLQDRGFRLLQLVLRNFQEPVTIHSLKAVHRVYPTPVQAAFECDDPFLNQLWQMCATTLTACATDTFIDCPWREQAFWLCDIVAETPFYLSLTSDRALATRSLRLGADGQVRDGMMPAVYPSDHNNPHVVYTSISALWTIALSDYYLYTGDRALVEELLPAVDLGLDTYEAWRDAEGLIPNHKEYTNFIDWGYNADTAALGGTASVLNMLIAAACKRAAWMHQSAGSAERAAALARRAGDLSSAIARKFWLADQGKFYDCTKPPLGARSFSQHPHAVGLHFDLLDEPHRAASLDALLDPSLVKAEYYYQYFVLNALARGGKAKEALVCIRDLWGQMVRENSLTVWEVRGGRDGFGGAGSLCHGFSCAPLYFMQTVLLGIRPLRPGFAEFSFEPQALGLKRCSGQAPTPQGPIAVQWSRRDAESLNVEITVPAQTTGVLRDGRRLPPGKHSLVLNER